MKITMIERSAMNDNRIGQISRTLHGTPMKIIEYNSYKDILVEFMDGYHHKKRTNVLNFMRGKVKNPYDRTINGVGFLGYGDYTATKNLIRDRVYLIWSAMIQRCYVHGGKNKFDSYVGCSVCEEWQNFQNFAKWYNENYYNISGSVMTIDKDLLSKGNKIYGPETCVIIPEKINLLLVSKNSCSNGLPIGVHFDKSRNKYMACCGNNSVGNKKLGRFKTPEEAFQAYKKCKEELIKSRAEEYKDLISDKVYQALINYVVEETD